MSIYNVTFDLVGVFSGGVPQLTSLYGNVDISTDYAYASATSVSFDIDTDAQPFDTTLLRFFFDGANGLSGDTIQVTNLKIDGNTVGGGGTTIDYGDAFDIDVGYILTDTQFSPPDLDAVVNAVVTGTAGNDYLEGTPDADTINGLGGNDRINGGADVDTINGGDGDDRIIGGTGNDFLNGDNNNDTIYGGDGADTITGGEGNDALYGNAGNNTISGGNGNDRIDGGINNDILNGDGGADRIYGGAGTDTINGGDGNDRLGGNDGVDTIHGNNDNDDIRGGNGNDFLYGDAGDDNIDGQNDNDTIEGGAGSDTISGDRGNDNIDGGTENDFINGGQGADTLNGGTGDDIIHGGGIQAYDQYNIRSGSAFGATGVWFNEQTQSFYRYEAGAVNITTAKANAAAATLNGVGGHIVNITSAAENAYIDLLTGTGSVWLGGTDEVTENQWVWEFGAEAGSNFYNQVTQTSIGSYYENWSGGEPNDFNTGEDYIQFSNGGLWNDFGPPFGSQTLGYVIEWDASEVMADNSIDTINGGAGNDQLYGGGGNDIINGDGDNDIIYGQDGNDTIDGGLGTDVIYGGDGNDTITDFFGTNTLYGGAGSDNITAGSGTDFIYGGTGADTIDANGGNDFIYLANGDFVAGESITGDTGTDTIVLTNATTVDLSVGTISTVETFTGSAGNDVVTMTIQQADAFTTIDLAGGTNTQNISLSGTINVTALSLPTFSNVSVGNIVGSGGNDVVTITGAQINALLFGAGTIDLGGGTDTINLTSTSTDLNGLNNASFAGVGTVSASTAAGSVTIDLSAQTESVNVVGSNSGDTITTGSGASTVTGGTGNDVLDGGTGTDLAVFSGNWSNYTITLSGAVYTLVDNVGTDGTDTVTLFENFQFANGTVSTANLLNVAPTITSNGGGATASISIAENTTAVTTVTATDANALGAAVTYSISGGADSALFTINGAGVLSFLAAPDYESPNDNGSNNIYDVQVTATDGTLDDIQNISVAITDIDEGDVGGTIGTAGTITVGGSVLYDVDTGGDRDWYGVDLVAGTTYAVWARGTPSEAANSTDPRLYGIYDGTNTLVAGGNDDGGIGYESIIYFTPGATGTYYIDAGAYGGVVGEILLSVFEGGSTINSGGGGSTINGSAFADYIDGNGGNDTINGLGGSDILEGGTGNDILNGGDGADVLYGVSGSDTFVFDNFNGVDSVVDFSAAGGDRIDISGLLTGFTVGVDDIDDFVQFQDVGGSTIMRVDANGSVGGSSFLEVAVLEGNTGEVVQTLYDNGDIIV